MVSPIAFSLSLLIHPSEYLYRL